MMLDNMRPVRKIVAIEIKLEAGVTDVMGINGKDFVVSINTAVRSVDDHIVLDRFKADVATQVMYQMPLLAKLARVKRENIARVPLVPTNIRIVPDLGNDVPLDTKFRVVLTYGLGTQQYAETYTATTNVNGRVPNVIRFKCPIHTVAGENENSEQMQLKAVLEGHLYRALVVLKYEPGVFLTDPNGFNLLLALSAEDLSEMIESNLITKTIVTRYDINLTK